MNLPEVAETEGISLPPSSVEGPQNPKETKMVHIHRVKIVDDLVDVFMDTEVMNMELKMEFKNEMAVDSNGVSREVYTAFWEQFLEQCEGEEERVPRLRPDFSEAQWQAVGRIWAKGLKDHGVIPVRLSKAFILACIHGVDSVDSTVLMSSCFMFLSDGERIVVEKALQGSLEESEKEDLLDLFSRMGSHCLPSEQVTQLTIETMAHKALLQEPKYIIDCFSHCLTDVQLNLPHTADVLCLYESKKATNKKVAEMLETDCGTVTERAEHFQLLTEIRQECRPTQVGKLFAFLHRVLCSSHRTVKVTFNAETGFSRRPVAHTCGAILDVPHTYSSYPEFRTEFDNVLSSNFLAMDII